MLPSATAMRLQVKNWQLFAWLWVVLFVLYLPATHAGWVTDTVDWQYRVDKMDFTSYLNLTQTRVPSLYQFTQLLTWAVYKLLGFNHTAWHLLNITLQALNAALFYRLFCKMAPGDGKAQAAALGSVLLFCVCPHLSEVIVWKASFHYLTGMLMIVGILNLAMDLMLKAGSWRILAIAVIYAISAFSLEIFYLTPWLTLALVVLQQPEPRGRRAALASVAAMLLIFVGHIVLLRYITGVYAAHLGGNIVQPFISYARKGPMYLFHVLQLGRFFPMAARQAVYSICGKGWVLVVFYGISLAAIVFSVRQALLKKQGKVSAFALLAGGMCLVLISPVWLPEGEWVSYDRYVYILLPFAYAWLCHILVQTGKWWLLLLGAYTALNVLFTLKLNRTWQKTDNVLQQLVASYPAQENRCVLLLNLPDNLNGVPMASALPQSGFKLLYEVNTGQTLTNPVYDVASFNIMTPADGAHVDVVNDSTIKVTLNQWGTWWWYKFMGATSYENDWYRLNMVDMGHWYELTLKRPFNNYRLLYMNDGKWQTVNR